MRVLVIGNTPATLALVAWMCACAPDPAFADTAPEVVALVPAKPAIPGLRTIPEPATLITASGEVVPLPAGVFLTTAAFEKLNVEVVRLQDAETRLRAENASLRDSLGDSKSTWLAIGGVALAVLTYAIVSRAPELRARVTPAP